MYPISIAHLVVIDGHHLMYRAYWAIPRTLRTTKGKQVNTVFGMASMLLSILKQEEPDAIVLCFDAGDDTFRHREHGEYKKGRAETPDDFYEQIPAVFDLLSALRMQSVSDPMYEADDFLCSYARSGAAAGRRVSVITGDRDAMQIACTNIEIVVPHKGYQAAERFGPTDVQKKFGVSPEQIPDWKALAGDTSDNFSGVPGIGPKTASLLLLQHGSLEDIYDHLVQIPPAIRRKLEQGKESAFFCRRLATLVDTIPLPLSLANLSYSGIPALDVIRFLEEFEFTLLLRRFREFLGTPYAQRVFLGQADSVKASDQLTLFSS